MRNDLKNYADFIDKIRFFFKKRDVIEVFTPYLVKNENPCPYIEPIQVGESYLHTSPEFAMKSLLTDNSGDIYQISKVWRHEEEGRWHRIEFTMLEWYRQGWSMQQLMNEVVELVQQWLVGSVTTVAYSKLFKNFLGINIENVTTHELSQLCQMSQSGWTHNDWLDYIFTSLIAPKMKGLWLVIDYPSSQAALAKLKPEDRSLALRFELFYDGVELANGFEELNSSREQLERFEVDNKLRISRGQKPIPINLDWITSLDNMPACSGVALGVDRLYAFINNKDSLYATLGRHCR